MGYLKSNINFASIQDDLDAAKALNTADKEQLAKVVLLEMADKIKEQMK